MTRETKSGTNHAQVRAIAYLRVSMMREDAISPEIQEAAISVHAERNGRRIVARVADLDATGRNFRRQVQGAIGRVEAGDAAEIIVYRYDRWGRNAVEALANIRRVEMAGGSVVSATEPLDPETAIGRYNRTNSLALAEMQSDIIGENWRAALSNRVQRGLPATGNARFGYARLGRVPADEPHRYRRDPDDPDGERYVPDEVTGPVLRELYERFINGEGTTRLLRWLNGAGITTLRGGTWGIQSLVLTLDSGFAAGKLKVHDPRCGCRQPSRCKCVTFVPGAHEPLIALAQWEAYRARRAALRDVPPRSRAPAYPLTGLVRCGECQGPLIATWASGQAGFAYRCNRWVQHKGCGGVWVRRSLVEEAVLAKLRELSGDVDARAAAMAARARVTATARRDVRRLTADLARADRELIALVRRAATDKGVPEDVYEQAKAGLLAERAAAQAALAAAGQAEERGSGDYLLVARKLLETWDLIPPAQRRDILAALISRVVVTRTGYRTPARIDVIMAWEDAP